MGRRRGFQVTEQERAYALAHGMNIDSAGDGLAVRLRMAVDRYSIEAAAERKRQRAARSFQVRRSGITHRWITWRRESPTLRGAR